ncbi:MAG: adenosine-specific kinase, partial [Candidatus Rehaiarchaeum fermentans]|nr:adenosine-specific kinase [Candidatus Rehaiarchaeum fermentans]
MEEVKILPIKLEYSGVNIIIGQAHFIKTVEDLYEALVSSGEIRFGISFNEASGDRLIRSDGNDEKAIEISKEIAKKIGAGHVFVIVLSKGYPINVMKKIKEV